jgi:hypothetical protein
LEFLQLYAKILPMKKITPFFFAAILAAGCSTETITVHRTEPHTAVPVQSVTLMEEAPPGSVLIADLFASAENSADGAETAQANLKKSAAAVGANVLVLDKWNDSEFYWEAADKFRIEGHAYFAPPVNK